MRGSVIALLTLLAAAACAAGPASAGSQRVLVLLENLDLQQSHSDFFGGLSGRGYQLDFRQISDKKLQLKQWDEWLYDKLIIFATKGGECSAPLRAAQAASAQAGALGSCAARHRSRSRPAPAACRLAPTYKLARLRARVQSWAAQSMWVW